MAKNSTVTVSGRIRVRHQMSELVTLTQGNTQVLVVDGRNVALAGSSPVVRVDVRAQARRKVAGVWGTWRELGTDITNFEGAFSISSQEKADERRFRIDVRLQSTDLQVRNHGVVTNWVTVLEQETFRGAEDLRDVVLFFGDRAASSRDATGDLAAAEVRERADIWVLGRLVLKELEELGSPFQATLLRDKAVELVSPAATTYASPVTRDIHLERGESAHNVIHEMMHIWAYDNTRPLAGGQARIVCSLPKGTHEKREFVSTAFQEGFAEFATDQLEARLFGDGAPLPLNRASLASTLQLPSLEDVVHNDDGWENLLRILTTPALHTFDFGLAAGTPGDIAPTPTPPPSCASPSTTFTRILGSFQALPNLGFQHRLAVSEMENLDAVLDRFTKAAGGQMRGTGPSFKRLIDPADSAEPRDLFCS